ncbi:unnamed protein product, partial [Phaeothamnion confervicola]
EAILASLPGGGNDAVAGNDSLIELARNFRTVEGHGQRLCSVPRRRSAPRQPTGVINE